MATLSALMTMTKSPPSTLGVNVGLCLPRNRVAAATARRPSTTSVASMTCHVVVVSPAFGVYVGTALTFSSRVGPGHNDQVSVLTRRFGLFSATDIDPRPMTLRTPTGQLTGDRRCRSKRPSGQVEIEPEQMPAGLGPAHRTGLGGIVQQSPAVAVVAPLWQLQPASQQGRLAGRQYRAPHAGAQFGADPADRRR